MQVGTYVDGRTVNYSEDSRAFDVGGTPVSVEDVAAYDAAGQVDWLSDDLSAWARALFTGGAPADSPASRDSAEPKRGRLLGFRSRRRWKMVVAGLYYALCGLLFLGVFASAKPYAKSPLDIALDVTSYLLLVLLLLAPALLLSDFGYRDKLPLFKKRKPVASAFGLALVFLLLVAAAASADSFHSAPYKVAAEAEKAAAQKKQAAEDKAKADAAARAAAAQKAQDDAKRAAEASASAVQASARAAEASRTAAAQAQAKANADAAKAAAARQAASAADAQKKQLQQTYLAFESQFYATEKPASAAVKAFQAEASAASKGKSSALDVYGTISDAKKACEDAQMAYSDLKVPDSLPQDVRDMLGEAKQDVSTAYFEKSEAFDSMAKYMDSEKLSDLQAFKDKSKQSDAFTLEAAVKMTQAREKLGLPLAK